MTVAVALIAALLLASFVVRVALDRRPNVTAARIHPRRMGADLFDPAISLARQRYASGEIEREDFVRIMRALER